MVQFRANATGHLSPTPAERREATQKVWSKTIARAEAYQRRQAEAAQGAKSTAARSAGANEASKAQSAQAASKPQNAIGEEDLNQETFLSLLVAQMQHQDPLEPTDNEDMLANLAQFTSLEQMNNLNKNFLAFTETIGQQNMVAASGLLGREVAGVSEEGEDVAGTVSRVFMDGGTVFVQVGEHRLDLSNVSEVAHAASD
jgi:flagellar basal-body rod modification protein FlgD